MKVQRRRGERSMERQKETWQEEQGQQRKANPSLVGVSHPVSVFISFFHVQIGNWCS